MSRLPQELVSHIADFLPGDRPLAQYATISRSWQHAIERRTFRAVNVSSAQLDHFAATVSRATPAADRRRLVRCVTYTVVLPLCLPPDAPRESGMHVNDDFTKAITSLFSLLAAWSTSTDSSQSLALRIRASCSDPCHDHNVDRGVSTLRSVLKLVPPTTTALQPVPRVTSIDFGSSSSSNGSSGGGGIGQQWYRIDGTAAARICAALPDLQDAKLPVSDVSAHLVSAFARGSTRRGIADALADLPRSLTSLCIDVPDFVAPPFRAVAHASSSSSSSSSPPFSPGRGGGGGYQLSSSTGVPRANFVDDPLSAALHALSLLPSMTTMRIGGALAVSPCLFWPADLPLDVVPGGSDFASSPPSSQPSSSHSHSSSSSSSSDAKPAMLPFWPRLQTLTLSFSPTTLSGTPYVTTVPRGAAGGGGAAGTGAGPATTANPDTVNPLFLAAALAATRMPRLRFLEVATAAGRGCGAASLAVGFAGAGVEAPGWVGVEGKGEEGEQGARVWISVPGVELDGRVEEVWAARVGKEESVRWV